MLGKSEHFLFFMEIFKVLHNFYAAKLLKAISAVFKFLRPHIVAGCGFLGSVGIQNFKLPTAAVQNHFFRFIFAFELKKSGFIG